MHVAANSCEAMTGGEVSRSLGVERIRVVYAGDVERRMEADEMIVRTPVLGGNPVRVCDLRSRGAEAGVGGQMLVADLAGIGPLGCAACHLGADAVVWDLGELSPEYGAWALVGVTRHALACEAWADLAQADKSDAPDLAELEDVLATWERSRRAKNDAALVLASYLRCHPAVGEVVYPGLKDDASYEVASRQLLYGFGPMVDVRLTDGTWLRVEADDSPAQEQVMALERRLLR